MHFFKILRPWGDPYIAPFDKTKVPYLKGFCIYEIFRYEIFRNGRFRRYHKDDGWVKSHTDLNHLN